MADRNSRYFNCSEEHELNQVSGKYRDKEKVKFSEDMFKG